MTQTVLNRQRLTVFIRIKVDITRVLRARDIIETKIQQQSSL